MTTGEAETAHGGSTHESSQGHAPEPVTAHGHDHEEPSEPLGPVDVAAWAAAAGGGAVGLLTALALYAAAHL